MTFGTLAMIGPCGKPIHCLANDAHRLPHLLDADQVPVVGIAVQPSGNFEVEILVGFVGLRFAQVPLHAAGAKYRAGNAQRNAIFRIQNADALGALNPDAIGGQQLFVLVELGQEEVTELQAVLLETVVSFIDAAADAKRVRGKASAAILLEDSQAHPSRSRKQ